MSRKIIIFCIVTLLLLTCSYTAFAEDFDQNKLGAISVTLIEPKQNQAIVGAELSVYHVATALMDLNGDLVFDYTDGFKQLGIAIDDASLALKLDTYVSKRELPSVKMTTEADGTAICNGLASGLYFVKQTGAVDGFAPCTPFLVTIPDEKNGEYVYEVNASPKTEVSKLTSITVKKVWNTDNSTEATNSVTVELVKNGEVVKTAILSKSNDWQLTYDNMPQSDAYSVRELDIPKGFTATYKREANVFTVTNTSTLIQTGQLTWPIPVLALGGMLLIAAGVMILQKKRNINE